VSLAVPEAEYDYEIAIVEVAPVVESLVAHSDERNITLSAETINKKTIFM